MHPQVEVFLLTEVYRANSTSADYNVVLYATPTQCLTTLS